MPYHHRPRTHVLGGTRESNGYPTAADGLMTNFAGQRGKRSRLVELEVATHVSFLAKKKLCRYQVWAERQDAVQGRRTNFEIQKGQAGSVTYARARKRNNKNGMLVEGLPIMAAA